MSEPKWRCPAHGEVEAKLIPMRMVFTGTGFCPQFEPRCPECEGELRAAIAETEEG
jgi:hypothetical protein